MYLEMLRPSMNIRIFGEFQKSKVNETELALERVIVKKETFTS